MKGKRLELSISCVLLLAVVCITTSIFYPEPEKVFSVKYLDSSLGVASGDVTFHSVILWSKTNVTSRMNIEYSVEPGFRNFTHDSVYVDHINDYVGNFSWIT